MSGVWSAIASVISAAREATSSSEWGSLKLGYVKPLGPVPSSCGSSAVRHEILRCCSDNADPSSKSKLAY